jgi:hypothetical protein
VAVYPVSPAALPAATTTITAIKATPNHHLPCRNSRNIPSINPPLHLSIAPSSNNNHNMRISTLLPNLTMKMLFLQCLHGTTVALCVNRIPMSMRWRWEACTIRPLNLCSLNPLVLRYKSTHIRQMQVLTVVMLRLRRDIRRMVTSNLSNMDMDTKALVLHPGVMKLVLTHRLAITLLLLVHRVLRESLLVGRGGTSESDSSCYVFVTSCIAWVFYPLFFRDTHMMREGQIAGSGCSSSILCLFIQFVASFRCCSLLLCPPPLSPCL